MSTKRKHDWHALGVISLIGMSGLLIFLGLVLIRKTPLGLFFVALGAGVFLMLLLLLRWRKKRYPTGITTDEREEIIRMRAASAGMFAMFVFFFLACMIPFFICRYLSRETITIEVGTLPMVFCLGAGVFGIVALIATRFLRGSDESTEEN